MRKYRPVNQAHTLSADGGGPPGACFVQLCRENVHLVIAADPAGPLCPDVFRFGLAFDWSADKYPLIFWLIWNLILIIDLDSDFADKAFPFFFRFWGGC